MSSIDIGKIVKLQGLSAQKVYSNGEWVTHGYVLSGEPIKITIDEIYGGGITDKNGVHHNLHPSFDDDFSAIVLEGN